MPPSATNLVPPAFRRVVTVFTVLTVLGAVPSRAPFFAMQPLIAQEEGRIWGRVTTTSGEVHEGFVRWDRNEGSWVDLLNGSKDQQPVVFRDWWTLAHPDDPHRDRVIEVAGYRITWDDNDLDWPSIAESGIRFGHVRRMDVVEDDRVRLELKSGLSVELEGGSTDLGTDLREIQVYKADGRVVELEWEEFKGLEFGPGSTSRLPPGERLHGTVTDRDGMEYTGFISWGPDQILSTDTLTGRENRGEREIPFRDIATIEKSVQGARVTLTDGGERNLFGSDDVSRGHDGVLISDPGLGMVEVEWREFEKVRFFPPERQFGYAGFEGPHRLRGTVETGNGDEITGWILWDGDEGFSWELLDGERDDVVFDIEFGKVARIERTVQVTVGLTIGPEGANAGRTQRDGASVTLTDGRVLELDNSNDVDSSNKGIFVLQEGGASPDDSETEWIRVSWEDFRSVRFDHGGGR